MSVAARPPGRVFCIGRNYAEHARELANPVPAEPVVFMKPAASLVPPGRAVPFPRHGRELHEEVEIVVRIGAGGRAIAEADALSHVDAVSVGFDLTLRDLQRDLKAQGLPWEKAKAFEASALLGGWVPSRTVDLAAISFRAFVDDALRQQGHTGEMLFPVARLVAALSAIWTLAPGDLIYTGTPAGVGPVAAGQRLVAEAEGVGRFEWRIEGP